MRCVRCKRDNPPENAYCGGCGAPLSEATRKGSAPPDRAKPSEETPRKGPGQDARRDRSYTPPHLSRGVLASRSALQGERKHVTVLFADIKSSTQIAGGIDPEEWHRILDGFFGILTPAIHRYAGTVNQYTGDGIMALFGAPLAHDDHARRACDAALAIQDGLKSYETELARRGLTLGVRIGLNTGEVVVGKIGDELRMDYTAQGQTVGLAARAEETAAPGAIHLTESTAAQVEGYFELERLGPFELHGADSPTLLFALHAKAEHLTRLDLASARGLAPLVGREHERGVLARALELSAVGKAEVIGLVGPPGVGKSRLCLQLLGDASQAGFQVCELRCPPHGSSLPFGGAQSLLLALLGIPSGAEPGAMARSVEKALEALGSGVGELLPWVEELLSLPRDSRRALRLDPSERREHFGAVLRRLIQTERADPTLLWIDDAHWLDEESQRVLADFIDAMGFTRTLLLISYRPELEPRWPNVSYRRELHIGPLKRDEARELLLGWLGEDPEVEKLVRPILDATSGNPFFVEEVVRELVRGGSLAGERGAHLLGVPVSEIAIPNSIQDAIAARVDALPENGKHVVQLASAIGQSVSRSVLTVVAGSEGLDVGSALPLLDRMELLRSDAPDADLHFEHALIQEVAYAAQLRDVRQRRHAEIARAIETLNADHLGPHAALIAHHWHAAGREARARRWRMRAAMRVSQIQVQRLDRPEEPPRRSALPPTRKD